MTEERKMLEILNRLNIEYKEVTNIEDYGDFGIKDGNKLYIITFDNPYHPLSVYFDKNGNCTDLILW